MTRTTADEGDDGGWSPEDPFGEAPIEEAPLEEAPFEQAPFEDKPETHLGDEDYDTFVATEFDARGRERGDPPVTLVIVILTVVVLGLLVLVFR